MQRALDSNAVVIGGGFYGATIAIYLARQRRVGHVVLLEREDSLLTRASYSNQARVHNGYHYPRSFTTAFRSRVNLPRFMRDWPSAVKTDFQKIYAISRRNSKITARQFERFCNEIGAKLLPVSSTVRALFDERLIESVFGVEEYAFDSRQLAEWARRELVELGVELRFNTRATAIRHDDGALTVSIGNGATADTVRCRYVFNCSYSGLNQLGGDYPGTVTRIKQEVTEMALVRVPPAMKDMGVTVMDGPFFSLMPFPARTLHTLSHVRYTPHFSWVDAQGVDPYQRLAVYDRQTRVERMIRDVARYVPILTNVEYVDSLFEVKSVLMRNESDDGRPILFERHASLPGCFSILGGKIDNIYDVLERLDNEPLDDKGLRT